MLCSKCGKKQATVHYKKIVNGKLTELYLCPDCAGDIQGFGLNDFLPNIFGHVITPKSETVCKNCGMSLSRLSKGGKLGCSRCYSEFEEYLTPTFKKIHGNVMHTGKSPKNAVIDKSDGLDELKAKLSEAIKSERYEEAAELRDKIKELQNKGGASDE